MSSAFAQPPLCFAALAWATGAALFYAAVTLLSPDSTCALPDAASAPAAADNSTDLATALEAWDKMWTAIEEDGAEAFDVDIERAGARYAGDTCGMRYRRLYRNVAPKDREQLAIAAFSNDPETKRRILEPLTGSPNPAVRGRAAIELARVELRQSKPGAAEAALIRAGRHDVPEPCEADRQYLFGRVALLRGDPETALDAFTNASVRDPGFWNAYRDRIPLLVRLLRETGRNSAVCLERARRLIETIGIMPQLADDTRQFAELALLLGESDFRSSATLLASGLSWVWAGDDSYGRGVLEQALHAPQTLPEACEQAIRRRAASALRSGR